MNDKLPLTREDMQLLAQVGFMGADSGQAANARALFEALRVLRPDSTLPFIGIAAAHQASNKPEEAVRVLRNEALRQHPGDGELMAFLGLALQQAGQGAEARCVFHAVVKQAASPDEAHVRMAAKALASTQDLTPLALLWRNAMPGVPQG